MINRTIMLGRRSRRVDCNIVTRIVRSRSRFRSRIRNISSRSCIRSHIRSRRTRSVSMSCCTTHCNACINILLILNIC